MKLGELGEFGMIEKFAKNLTGTLPEGFLGIGDDAAAFPISITDSLLVTTDMLVEGQHFLLDKIAPYDLGRKCVAVNFSDLAAMGGKPTSVFLSLAVSTFTDSLWLQNFFWGIKDECETFSVKLLGGDTVGSKQAFVINITALGTIESRKIKTRSAALPNDLICLTGTLGDSAAGFRLLKEVTESPLITLHHRPRPHVEEGLFLANFANVHAMMDVSDGIGSDLLHILEMSGVGARIDLERLPLSAEFNETCRNYGWDAYELAVNGGEDYCLLFTTDPEAFAELNKYYHKQFGREISVIGKITENKGALEFFEGGLNSALAKKPFRHF